jgi:hypothetical protein
VHFIGTSLFISTIAYFVVGRIFGPNGAAASLTGLSRGSRMPRRGAAQGLFAQPGEKEQIEFGYCFDVYHHRPPIQVHGLTDFLNDRSRTEPSSPSTYTSTSSNSSSSHSSPAIRQTFSPLFSETRSTFLHSYTIHTSPSSDTTPYHSYTTRNCSCCRSWCCRYCGW